MPTKTKPTQKEQVLQLLKDRGQRGVTSIEFVTILGVLNYTARIDELRNDDGWVIDHSVDKARSAQGKQVHRYRLVSEPQTALFDAPESKPSPVSAVLGEAA